MTSIFLSVVARMLALLAETIDLCYHLCYHAHPGRAMASLIYHSGALGDFITTLPAIARWREDRPGERLILLGRPAHASIATPPFDETWDAEAPVFSPLFSGSVTTDSPLAGRLGKVTSALLFAASSSSLAESLARVGVREIVRQDPFPTSAIHVIDYHLSLFPLRDRGEDRIPRIRIPELESQDVVAIHTGSGSAGKNWPRERYIQLAARLIERGERIAWIVGPAETGLEPFPGGDVWRSLTLPWLAARLARCRLYVGNDSGVTHLAAAAGCPTVALFGQSDPGVWAPRGVRVRILGAGSHGMRSIELEDVLRACEVFLKVK